MGGFHGKMRLQTGIRRTRGGKKTKEMKTTEDNTAQNTEKKVLYEVKYV